MADLLSLPVAASHIARANEAARNCPDAFGRAVWLAQASARVRSERFWPHVSAAFKQFTQGIRHPKLGGKVRREFFSLSAKWEGICYNWNNRADLQRAVFSAPDPVSALSALVDGSKWLSTVKGGFVLQLTIGDLGCIDSVNKRLYGLDTVTTSPTKYAQLCADLGGSVALWAQWCNAVALERNADPVAISKAHADFIETGEAAPVLFG